MAWRGRAPRRHPNVPPWCFPGSSSRRCSRLLLSPGRQPLSSKHCRVATRSVGQVAPVGTKGVAWVGSRGASCHSAGQRGHCVARIVCGWGASSGEALFSFDQGGPVADDPRLVAMDMRILSHPTRDVQGNRKVANRERTSPSVVPTPAPIGDESDDYKRDARFRNPPREDHEQALMSSAADEVEANRIAKCKAQEVAHTHRRSMRSTLMGTIGLPSEVWFLKASDTSRKIATSRRT